MTGDGHGWKRSLENHRKPIDQYSLKSKHKRFWIFLVTFKKGKVKKATKKKKEITVDVPKLFKMAQTAKIKEWWLKIFKLISAPRQKWIK